MAAVPHAAPPAPTLLIIDDNMFSRRIACAALERHGYRVFEAGDGETAIKLLAQHRPALVLLDVHLAPIDGNSVISQLRANAAGAEIPILGFSGLISKTQWAQAVRAGYTDYVFKSAEPLDLVGIVASYLPTIYSGDARPGCGRRVLLVVDEPALGRLTAGRLVDGGFVVELVADGTSALVAARVTRPDAIVVDLLMSGMNGMALCLAVRRDPELTAIPVIIASTTFAALGDGDQQLAAEIAADGFVEHTPSCSAMIARLIAVIDQKNVRVPGANADALSSAFVGRQIQELKHHAWANTTLARQAATNSTLLSVMAGFADVVKREHDLPTVLHAVLAGALDAGEVSAGAIYVLGDDRLPKLSAQVGFPDSSLAGLDDFFGASALLRDCSLRPAPTAIPSPSVDAAIAESLLARAGVRSLVIVPLLTGGESSGALVLCASATDLGESLLGSIAAVASQIGQAVSLSRTMARLTRSESRLKLISENVLDLVALIGLDGTFLYVSPSYETVLGYSREALVGTSAFAPGHPDDLERIQATFASGVHMGEGRGECRLRHADGHYLWLDARGKVAVDDAGLPIGVILSTRDITAQKEQEAALALEREALRDSESRYRSLVHAMPGILYSYSVTRGGIYYSPQAEAKLGYTAEFLQAHPRFWHDAIHPEDLPAVDAAVEEGARSGGRIEIEYRIRTATGTWRWFLDRSVRITTEVDGDMIIDGLATDITEQRAADASLRLQSAALDAAADAIVITDQRGTIEWVNPAFTAITGYGPEEALGMHHRDLVNSGKQDPLFFKNLWDTIQSGKTWRGELINRRKDGSLYSLLQVITPIRSGAGPITKFVAIQQDITERRQFEAHMRQTQRMESVGQLASGIAHDFNNLLTVINGISELLLMHVGKDDLVRADIQEIRDAGERAATLTRQLLAFSRQQILEPRVMNLNAAITGMESLLRRLIGEDVRLVIVPARGLGSVRADPGQIEQVVTNMAVNSRDAMPRGGQLTIETQNVTIDETYAQQHDVEMEPGKYVLLSVTDSGSGMDEETRTRLFEPFFTTKGPERGTGLGLSTAYGIIKQSHGFVWVYSEVGLGTTFKIYLPRVTDVAARSVPEPSSSSWAGTETILLVEDNTALRKLAARLLEPAGYAVLQAASAEEALQLLDQHDQQVQLLLSPVDLLVTDVVMPGMSGQKLAEQLAQSHPKMKVLFMSGYTDDTTVRHGVLQAQMAFLSKPFTRESLLRKVREVLDAN